MRPASLRPSERDCGRSPSRSAIADRGALEWLSACSHSVLLRLVLRTQPRAGPLRFGTAPNQISHSERFDNPLSLNDVVEAERPSRTSTPVASCLQKPVAYQLATNRSGSRTSRK